MRSLKILSDFNQLSYREEKNFHDIDSLYDEVSIELERLATFEDEMKSLGDDQYIQLQIARERLISLALDLDIHGLADIKNLLRFWHKIAVLETAKQDLLMTDHLIIAIHDYFSPANDLVA